MPLLKVDRLHVTFSSKSGSVFAVRGVSFELQAGQSIGIVGESGCGKSALLRGIANLSRGSISGEILFEGKREIELGKKVGMVFQDPMSALNPTKKIGHQLIEGFLYHQLGSKSSAKQKAIQLLHLVGILDPELKMNRYPHELSGGQRQRVLIAIALMANPSLLLADEPTTALDFETQIQLLQLIRSLQKRFSMGLVLVSHDLSLISEVCDEVLVMYAGKIVEKGPPSTLLTSPRHPYTRMLLEAIPKPGHPLRPIPGSPPNLQDLPQGCSFKERCPFAALKCREEPKGETACWRVP